MRANDFVVHNENKEVVQEDKERLDEVLPAIVGAVWLAGMGWTAWDTYKNVQAYRRGEITGQELTLRIGADAALTIFGGAAGKAAGAVAKTGYQVGKAAIKGTTAAAKKANTAMQKGLNVVTGKPLKPKAPAPKPKKPATPTKAGQAAGTIAAKGKKVGQAVGANVRKAGEKILKNPIKTGAAAALLYGKTTGLDDKFAAKWDELSKQQAYTAPGDDIVYFGKEKNPPMKKVVGVNDPLYTKPGTDSKYTKPDPVKPKTINSNTMDSNSPVSTAKDPKLPKQNTTSLATQPGVK